MIKDLDLYFRYKCEQGLRKRGLAHLQEYIDRLEFEISVILKMDYAGYFLIQADMITWAKRQGILVGPGRGSAAGSLCTYCLEITDLDPIKYGLLFERFINPERVSLPDIDVDYAKDGRYKVIDYTIQKYGADKVAHIGTFGYLKAKSAVRSMTKVLGHPYDVGDKLSKILLGPIHGKYQSITESVAKVPELGELVRSRGIESDIIEKATAVEMTINNVGVHASGMVISNEPLLGRYPTFLGGDEEVTTQWDMHKVEDAGLVKFDFLGLDTLDRIAVCLNLIKKNYNQTIDIVNIPVDDDKVFENLRGGDTCGIFQLESSTGIKDLLIQIKPTVLEDIIVLVAAYRPGPLSSKEFQHYLKVRQGLEKPVYLIPELKPILQATDGLMVYQEQILRIARDLCRYTLGEADLLRRAIGKKKEKEMAEQKEKFCSGWVKNGYPVEKVEVLWKDIVGFADYCFNKSHAACYGFITYQTAWLKTHYPIEWMTAIMICEGDTDQIIRYISECKRLGIKVLAPNINKSENTFSIDEDNNVRFGLAKVKNLGTSPVGEIINKRADGRFDDILDFCERVDLGVVNRLKLESLIKAGAFDNGIHTRAAMVKAVEEIWEYRSKMKSYLSKMETYNKRVGETAQRLIDIEAGKLSETGKALRPLKDPEKPIEPNKVALDTNLQEYTQQEVLQYEHELLGYYVTGHPMDEYQGTVTKDRLLTLNYIKELKDSASVTFGAVVTGVSEITTAKNKQKMAFLVIEDTTGQIDGVVFSSSYGKFKDIISSGVPLLFTGRLNVTELDDKRTVKINLSKISVLEKKEFKRKQVIELSIPVDDTKNLIKKYERGTTNALRLTFDFHDGTKVKCTETVYVK